MASSTTVRSAMASPAFTGLLNTNMAVSTMETITMSEYC